MAGRTPVWAIAVVAVSTVLLSTAQVLLKLSVGKPFPAALYNPLLYASLAIYIAAGVMMVTALKHGELSVLYPVVSLGFIWVMLASIYLLHESPSWHQILGTAIIIAGISVIGHTGSRRKGTAGKAVAP
jgi:undecaprenyl phosphate-alpha-L-ara4N flippase subunit ArnE